MARGTYQLGDVINQDETEDQRPLFHLPPFDNGTYPSTLYSIRPATVKYSQPINSYDDYIRSKRLKAVYLAQYANVPTLPFIVPKPFSSGTPVGADESAAILKDRQAHLTGDPELDRFNTPWNAETETPDGWNCIATASSYYDKPIYANMDWEHRGIKNLFDNAGEFGFTHYHYPSY